MEAGNLAIYSIRFICACKKLLRYPGLPISSLKFSDIYREVDCSIMGYTSFPLYKVITKLLTKVIVQMVVLQPEDMRILIFSTSLPILIASF